MKAEIIKEVASLNLSNFNEDISYCGNWSLNDFRSSFNVHKWLPFNRMCYIHDKGYFYLSEKFGELRALDFLLLKIYIDVLFLASMIKATFIHKNSFVQLYKFIVAVLFFVIVLLFTPIYWVGFWWNSKK